MFGNNLPSTTLVKIVSTVLTENEEEDYPESIEGQDEAFTVRKAYEKTRVANRQPLWPGWTRILKLKIQERIKTFMWLLAHEGLLSSYIRCKRKVEVTSECQLCNGLEETNLHAVRDCPDA